MIEERGHAFDETGGRRRDSGTLPGVVTAQLPSGLYQVEIEAPRQGTASAAAGRHRVTAHAGGGSERNFVRLLVGDRVLVELMPRDANRGRVVKKL